MKPASYFSFAATAAIATTLTAITSVRVHSEEPLFSCETSSGVPTTVVHSPKHGSVKIIEWKTTEFGEKFNPNERCKAVSQKFEQYAKAGTLKYFTTGSVNRQPVICAVASKTAPCNAQSMLYTLKKGTDAKTTLKQLLDLRSGSGSNALNETESRIYVDFDKVVETKAQINDTSNSDADNNEAVYLF